MIHASIGPFFSIAGSTISRTLARTASSDQAALPTKCSSDWCWAAVRAGAVRAAIGSTLLRSQARPNDSVKIDRSNYESGLLQFSQLLRKQTLLHADHAPVQFVEAKTAGV
jgi:hypothetical protein